MRKAMMHLAQFLCHSPTYHSLAMWRHPRTAAAGYDWARPELYQHIAQVCERGRFDMVFFADLNYISDTFTGSLAPALRNATQAPEHDPIPLLSFMAAATTHHRARRHLLRQPSASVPCRATVGDARSSDARARGVERRDLAQPQPGGQLRRGLQADRRSLRPGARVHQGLPQAVGQLGRGRRRDGPRGRHLRRSRQGASHRARGPLVQVARAAQRRALAAERPGHPAGRHVGQGPRLRRALCRRRVRDPAQPRRRQGPVRRHQARRRRGGPAGQRLQVAVRRAADHRLLARRGARTSRPSTTRWCRWKAAWRSCPAISTSTSRPCRSTPSWRTAPSPSCSACRRAIAP